MTSKWILFQDQSVAEHQSVILGKKCVELLKGGTVSFSVSPDRKLFLPFLLPFNIPGSKALLSTELELH